MSREHIIGAYSAYAIAVKYGYTGTEEQWVNEQAANRVASEQAAQKAEQARCDAETAASRSSSAADRAETAQQSTESIKTDAITAIGTNKQEALDAVQTAKDGAVKAVQTAQETATKAVSTAQTSATAAVEKKGKDVLATIPEDYTNLNESVGQLKEEKLDKPDNPVVGQLLRVKSITDDGDIVLETVAGGGGGGGLPEGGTAGQVLAKKTDASGDAEWTDKAVVLTTPLTQTQDELISLMQNGPLYVYNNGLLYTVSRLAKNTLSGYGPIIYSGKSYTIQSCVIEKGIFRVNPYSFIGIAAGGTPGQLLAKKSATNGDTQWVDPQTATVRTAMDDVAVAGAKYFLGEQTELSITMPTDAQTGQEIVVVFSSGETACTLAVDIDNFDFVPKANSTCKIVFLCVDTETWLVDAKEG